MKDIPELPEGSRIERVLYEKEINRSTERLILLYRDIVFPRHDDGEIDYLTMDTIAEEEHKVKRYQLEPGDVVLSCRGTAIKSAEFQLDNKVVIASANLIVIRPKGMAMGKYIKIFLEIPVGIAMIKSFQRGTTIMNINHSDIAEMEIPLLTMEEQQEIINQYENEFSIYKQAISQAENRGGR